MENKERIYLKENDEIKLTRTLGGRDYETFIIKSLVGEGSSSVCYWAQQCNSDGTIKKTGRLKEFYPDPDAFAIEIDISRDMDNQLMPMSESSQKNLRDLCTDFEAVYTLLDSKRAQALKNSDEKNVMSLNNYIPVSEKFYGMGVGYDGEECSGFYVWTPDDKYGLSFDNYLQMAHEKPQENSGQKLYNIISAIITLAKSICALHLADLVHLDIKPSNFMVLYDGRGELNFDSISLFDLSSISPMASKKGKIQSTVGYFAPELKQGKADARSDIYSLGALLFKSIVTDNDNGGILYNTQYYINIDDMLSSSSLLQSDVTSNVNLKFKLIKVLKRCLARHASNRYQSCSEFVDALVEARSLIGSKEEVVADDGDSVTVMQELLYKHPLYDWVKDDEENINVLVAGGGTYSQKFIDICLQAGQMKGKKLNINVISDKPKADKETYLSLRRALADFVDVDGSLKGKNLEAYARLNFAPLPGGYESFSKTGRQKNANIVKETLKAYPETQYIFIAMGDDKLNKNVAEAFVNAQGNYMVNFVWTGVREEFRKGNAVFVNDALSIKNIDNDLERMAFLAHLLWDGGINVDKAALYNRFRANKYNYNASIAFALSVKYKLKSVGIDSSDLSKAAHEFYNKVLTTKNKSDFNELVALEHRRWVIEKLCDNWAPPIDSNGEIDYNYCAKVGKAKDASNKLHGCIVRSTTASPLSGKGYNEKNRENWSKPELDKDLDGLDLFSVRLHRAFAEMAQENEQNDQIIKSERAIIAQAIANENDNVMLAYNKLDFCIKNILANNEGYAKKLGDSIKTFEKSLSDSDEKLRKDVLGRVKKISSALSAIIEACMYRDYKANDEILIAQLPFILTYKTNSELVMVFDEDTQHKGKSEKIFANVASATVTAVSKITYLYHFSKKTDVKLLDKAIRSAWKYFNTKGIKCRINFIFTRDAAISEEKRDMQDKVIDTLKMQGIINRYSIFTCNDESQAADAMLNAMSKIRSDILFDGSNTPFDSHLHNAIFACKVPESYPYFEFEWNEKQFKNCKGCEHLRYIKDNSFMSVEDMFSIRNAVDNKFNIPEFYSDYEELWKIYTGEAYMKKGAYTLRNGVVNWTSLCSQLADKSKSAKLAEIRLDKYGEELKYREWYMPDYCYKALHKILKTLINSGAVSEASNLCNYTTDTCRLELYTQWDIFSSIDNMLVRPELLSDVNSITFVQMFAKDTKVIVIKYNTMWVEDMILENEFAKNVLELLYEKHFVNNLKYTEIENDGNAAKDSWSKRYKVSFTYSSPRIKKLLTTEGDILELYTYYEALKQGYFDDIVSGYEFKWENSEITNEIDCILTKGFKSIVVECKSQKSLDQNYYYKLYSISEEFGIGTEKVMIANTYEHSKHLDSTNALQINRGNRMDIYTIYDSKEIMNIGKVLVQIMEGTYKRKEIKNV